MERESAFIRARETAIQKESDRARETSNGPRERVRECARVRCVCERERERGKEKERERKGSVHARERVCVRE